MKLKTPIEKSPVAQAILNELDLYARDKQFIPVEYALFSYMTRPRKNEHGEYVRKYEFSHHSYHYWFERLVKENYIAVDEDTHAIRLCRHVIIEKDDPDLD